MENTLFYGDNLHILREYIKDESIDLIYLDPPFNSNANYNILYKEPSGRPSNAQITAFEDTWHWTEETEKTFQEIINSAPADVIEMMRAFLQFIGRNDVMAYLTMMSIRLLELKRVLKNTGSIYLHCDQTASHYLKILMDSIFDAKHFRREIIWASGDVSGYKSQAKNWIRAHDTILFYTKSNNYIFKKQYLPHKPEYIARFNKIDKNGRHYRDDRPGRRRQYLDETPGRLLSDVWTDIDSFQRRSTASEKLGYETQKPIKLLERILISSSTDESIILDPFCGCGTTITAAQKLKRTWLGIDITHLAINLIKWRLKDMFGLEPKKDYRIIGEPEDLSGAKELASQNRYQFQWWALSLIDARPYGDKKKGSDTGIDGYLYFKDKDDKQYKKAIIQVKSGHISVKDIRDLGHVIDREGAEIGIFITLEQPTGPMKKEAIAKGFYHSKGWGKDYPKLQILNIQDLLSGKGPNIPEQIAVHKKAEKSIDNTQNELKF